MMDQSNSFFFKVILKNISRMPMNFQRCSLSLEEILPSTGSKLNRTIGDWMLVMGHHNLAQSPKPNEPFELAPNASARVLFFYRPQMAASHQQLAHMSMSQNSKSQQQQQEIPLSSMETPKELLLAVKFQKGIWIFCEFFSRFGKFPFILHLDPSTGI